MTKSNVPNLKPEDILFLRKQGLAARRAQGSLAPTSVAACDLIALCNQAVNTPVILLRETVAASALRDLITFGSMVAATAAIYFMGGSGYLYGVMGVVWFMWITSRSMAAGRKAQKTPEEALKFLADNYPDLHTPYDPDHQWSDVHEAFVDYLMTANQWNRPYAEGVATVRSEQFRQLREASPAEKPNRSRPKPWNPSTPEERADMARTPTYLRVSGEEIESMDPENVREIATEQGKRLLVEDARLNAKIPDAWMEVADKVIVGNRSTGMKVLKDRDGPTS